jgi:hypothetical protein
LGSAPDAIVDDTPRGLAARLRHPSWGGAVGVFIVAAGWVVGLRPLADNSFLTHLSTGRLILESGSVPSSDAYTFTAAGEAWVVQSWLASVLYAGAERLGGLDAVRVAVACLAALLTGLGWSLLRPAERVLPRLAVVALFVGVGASLWAERPLMIGLNGLALVLLAAEGRLDARWLVPVGWVWVNSHGSFPLGVAVLLVEALGRRLDGTSAAHELRALRWFVPGVLLGVVGPLGLEALTFPVQLLQQQDMLSGVVEWRAPTFDTTSQRLFIVQLAVAVLALARRPSYRAALLIAVFGALALTSLRNVAVASLVLLPAMAPGLDGLGSLSSRARPHAARVLAGAGVGAIAILTLARSNQTDLELRKYPVTALAYLESSGVDTSEVRLAAPDFVGNLMEYVHGAEGRVFYDDRFDMFPLEVTAAQQSLINAGPRMREHLDDWDIDLVAIKAGSPSGQVLTLDPSWRALLLDDEWLLACRRGAALGGDVGTC